MDITRQTNAKSPKLLDQVRRCIRNKHYSLRTEEAYVDWIRWYIRFHGLKHLMDWEQWRSRPSCPA
jgi:hypothetical protein